MPKECCSFALLPCLAFALCVPAVVAAQKEIRQVEIHADGFSPPQSVDELWEKSALVIDGQLIDVRPANRTVTPTVVFPARATGAPVTIVQTDYVVRVHRVLKSDGVAKKHGTIVVRRSVGTIDRGTHIDEHVERGFAKFTRQGRYILFLEPTTFVPSPEPVYFPVAGADSAFELRGTQVLPLGRSVASKELSKLGAEQFVAVLLKRGGK